MSFLPDNYKLPTTDNYMKLQKGANKFRVLDSAIIGYEWWEDTPEGGRKPHRAKTFQEAVSKGIDPLKHFWAFPVWNYSADRVQILQLTQKSIMQAITSLVENEEWGDPKNYDINVHKEGEMLTTEYTVTPSPHKEINPEIVKAYNEMSINLTALFTGDDPFADMGKQVAEDVVKALK